MLTLTPELWNAIRDIQWRGNQHRYVTDEKNYSKREHWAMPNDVGADCEDIALGKSQASIAAGIAWEHQSIAYCKTELDGGHAVLLILTDYGTYCLDNRHDEVKSYDFIKNKYKMISQSDWGKPLDDPWLKIQD